MAEGAAVSDNPFVFDLFNESDPNDDSAYPARLISADGTESNITVTFNNGKASVELNADNILYICGMNDGHTFRISEKESVEYIAVATGLDEGGTVMIESNKLAPVSFVNAERGTGSLTVYKTITHPFGADYQIPENLEAFEMTVTLGGIGTANAEFTAVHTDTARQITKVQTDENGQFKVLLKHNEQITISGLPVETVVRVDEPDSGAGFTPTYWSNGEESTDTYGQAEITANNTASVIVENVYEPEKVSDINIELYGKKSILDAANNAVIDISAWDSDYIFEIILQRYNEEANTWEDVGNSIKLSKANGNTFTFDLSDEEYTKQGVYAYQVYEVEPDTADRVGGIIYDPVWHTFSVHVADTDMDGEFEIVRVHSEHANKDFEINGNGNYDINIDFTNIKSTSIPALVTIDVVKELVNSSSSGAVGLAGYNFGLYTDESCTIPAINTDFNNDGTDDIVIDSVATDAAGEGWIDVTFNEVAFENSDYYTFYVKEIDGRINNMTYSTKVVKVEVTLSKATIDNGAITNILADEVVLSDELTFTNICSPADAQLTIDVCKQNDQRQRSYSKRIYL